jgi:alkanesulfonate monooxygenase SsuD/methylene tetrahydromethanopterin reductase-like flavin-dependent oxidoreductase (luciferase family)
MIGIYGLLRFFEQTRQLPEYVRRWDQIGLDGIVEGDHLFAPDDPRQPGAAAREGVDQLTVLTAIAALSGRLRIGTTVSNVGFQHPLLLIRKFAQLAVMYGGDRVYAGFGAGWSRSEFDAIGLTMPPHAQRMARLEESVRLARTLFDEGYADIAGEYVTVRALPLTPMPQIPPRILVAGGSPRLIGIAARYADHIDLNVPSHRTARTEPQKRLITSVDDLADSVRALRDATEAAGRARGAVETSVIVDGITFCRASEVDARSRQVCERAGLPGASLRDCPYQLVGEPAQMAGKIRVLQQRLQLSWLAVPFYDAERFCAEVVPLLG